jgi:hypothetical protein
MLRNGPAPEFAGFAKQIPVDRRDYQLSIYFAQLSARTAAMFLHSGAARTATPGPSPHLDASGSLRKLGAGDDLPLGWRWTDPFIIFIELELR